MLSSEDRDSRLPAWIILACSVALFLPMTWPLVSGRVFLFDDLGHYHIPLRYLYQRALLSGDSLLWTPSLFAGFYIHAEGQLGMFHPLHLLLYLIFPLRVAFNLEFLVSYVIAFGGMWWLLRRLELSQAAALFGSMLFAFGGFLVLHHQHVNLVAVTAHLPWLLACIDLLITGDTPRARAAGSAGISLVLMSAILLGFPQAIWWMMLTAGPFALLRAGETGRWRRLIPGVFAVAIGVLLGGIQLLPTLDLAAESVRQHLPRAFFLSYSLHPWNIVQFWSPYALADRAYSSIEYLHVHEFGIYSGAILTVAPLWLWIRRRALAGRRPLIVSATAFAAVMLILALGEYGYLDILLTYLPGVGVLRAPSRYIVLVQFALTILAAIAFDDLMLRTRNDSTVEARALRSTDAIVLCAVAALSVLTTLLLNTHVLPVAADLPVASIGKASIGVFFVVAVTIAILLAARGVRWGVPLLIVLTAADLGAWGLTYVYRVPPDTIDSLTLGLPVVSNARIIASEGEWKDMPILKGYRLMGGYVGIYPAIPYTSVEFNRSAGAAWDLKGDGIVTKIPWHEAPRARLVVEDPLPPANTPGELGSAKVTMDRPGRLVVKTTASAPRLLVLNERFDKGWSATVDGKNVSPVSLRGFLSFRAESGMHEVEFRFLPRSFVLGCLATGAGIILLAVSTLVTLRERK